APSDTFAGCVRLVLPATPSDPLPFERLCAGHMYDDVLEELVPDRRKVGEISRLAVRSNFRRRRGEKNLPEGVVEERRAGAPAGAGGAPPADGGAARRSRLRAGSRNAGRARPRAGAGSRSGAVRAREASGCAVTSLASSP